MSARLAHGAAVAGGKRREAAVARAAAAAARKSRRPRAEMLVQGPQVHTNVRRQALVVVFGELHAAMPSRSLPLTLLATRCSASATATKDALAARGAAAMAAAAGSIAEGCERAERRGGVRGGAGARSTGL